MNTKQKLHQAKLSDWSEIFKAEASSGLTAKEWCCQNSVSIHAYNYWKHQLKENVVDALIPDIVPVNATLLDSYPECWVHARRPFAEFIKSVGEKAAKGSIAAEAYAMITEIMHLDNSFDDLPSGERLKQRQQVLLPKVDAFMQCPIVLLRLRRPTVLILTSTLRCS